MKRQLLSTMTSELFTPLRFVVFCSALCCTIISAAASSYPKITDVAISSRFVCCLSEDSSVALYDKTDMKLVNNTITGKGTIRAIATDRMQRLVVCDTANFVRALDEQSLMWSTVAHIKDTIFKVVFDSSNHCIAATPFGVENLSTHARYTLPTPKVKDDFKAMLMQRQWLHHLIIGNDDLIWLSYDFGEWGCSLVVVDSRSMTQVPVPDVHNVFLPWFNRITAFFHDGISVYCAINESWAMRHTALIKFQGVKAKLLFENGQTDRSECIFDEKVAIKYFSIFAATYNHFDSSIMFGCERGIFKCKNNKRTKSLESWKAVIKYTQFKSNGEIDERRAWRNFRRIECLDAKRFVYVMYDGTLKYFNGNYSITVRE